MPGRGTMARITALHRAASHEFSKQPQHRLRLIAGEGVEGDAHRGVTVQHRSRVRADPAQPNLRQVHLLHAELFSELSAQGFAVAPGQLGENITTSGIALLTLPRGTLLELGVEAVIQITGLRNPCQQIEDFQPGLLHAVLGRDAQGGLIRKAGIMAIVRQGGVIRIGDRIASRLPPLPHETLERV
jgi:MOSC domain-containing protein YiiM